MINVHSLSKAFNVDEFEFNSDVFYRLFNHQEINSLCFFCRLPLFFLPFFVSVAIYLSFFLHCENFSVIRKYIYIYILRAISEIRNINFDGTGVITRD